MAYSSQTKIDANIIERVLYEASIGTPTIRFLEVGTYQGDTSREIMGWCQKHGKNLEFWGIDAGWHPEFSDAIRPPVPFEGANMVFGDSAEVFCRIPKGIDVALIDGCHCVNHVILDTIHYGSRVSPGGFMLFHDTAPHIQQTMRDPHGPDIPEFYNSVNLAHKIMGFPCTGWIEAYSEFDEESKWGGITVYRKCL